MSLNIKDFDDATIMVNLKGQIIVALTKHAGQLIVHGDEMESLIQDFVDDVLTEPSRRRWATEYLRRLDQGAE